MTKQLWIEKVKIHADVIRDFISRYHPANPYPIEEDISFNITAPQAEGACEHIRELIRNESNIYIHTDIQFDMALQNEDCGTLAYLLEAAWIGVPESTSCWSIPGFSIAVDLLDDFIEEE